MNTESKSEREIALEELVRSACAIAEREGAATAWARFTASAKSFGLNGVTARTYRLLPSEAASQPQPTSQPTVAAQQGSIGDDALAGIIAPADRIEEADGKPISIDRSAARIIDKLTDFYRAPAAPVAPLAPDADLEAQLASCIALSQKWASAAGEADGRAEKMREELSNTLQFLGDMHSMPVDWTIRESQVVYGRIRDLILPPQQEGSEAGNG